MNVTTSIIFKIKLKLSKKSFQTIADSCKLFFPSIVLTRFLDVMHIIDCNSNVWRKMFQKNK